MRSAGPCLGHGGHVYTYDGPQFGAQIVEEPCNQCGGWHDRRKPSPYVSPYLARGQAEALLAAALQALGQPGPKPRKRDLDRAACRLAEAINAWREADQ